MPTTRERQEKQPPLALESPTKQHTTPVDTEHLITATIKPTSTHYSSGSVELDVLKQEVREGLMSMLKHITTKRESVRSQVAKQDLAHEQQNIIAAMSALLIINDVMWQNEWVGLEREWRVDKFLATYGETTRLLIEAWIQTSRCEEDRGEEPRSSTTKQWQTRVAKWYGQRCILTHCNTVDACHILPDSITSNEDKAYGFFRRLSFFWPKDVVEKLKDFVKHPNHVAQNLVVLSKNAHEDWTKAKFALRPSSHTPTRLTLEFVWLAQTDRLGGIAYHRDTDTEALIHEEASSQEDPNLPPLRCGDNIVLVTKYPDEVTLPSWELLQLQWDMQNIVRASAQAEVLVALFREDPDIPGSSVPPVEEEEEEEEEDIRLRLPQPTPQFSSFLLDEAVEQGLITVSNRRRLERDLIVSHDDEELEELDMVLIYP